MNKLRVFISICFSSILMSCITYQTSFDSYGYVSENWTYLCTSPDSIYVYDTISKGSIKTLVIPPNRNYIAKVQNISKGYWAVKYKSRTGYVKKPKFIERKEVLDSNLAYLDFNDTIGYYINDSLKQKSYNSYSSPSYSGSSSYSGGSVHVKGYHRKDGTYVKPHTRSRPSRSSGRRR